VVPPADNAPADNAPADVRRSPLHDWHIAEDAKFTTFGGWEMPLTFVGTVAEHMACRCAAAVFDVSHLGTVRLRGPDAFDRLQATLSNDLRKIEPGRAQYTQLLDDDGSVLDDMIVLWVDEDRFDVMPNASNTERVLAAVGGDDVTEERVLLAIQGPLARAHLRRIFERAADVDRFDVATLPWGGGECLVTGTGYTGEDGLELAAPPEIALKLWDAFLEAGVVPAGLGARDTLRLEAGLPLHGHELGSGITPLQANVGWSVGWKKDTFPGKAALEREKADGPARTIRGLLSSTRQPLRDGLEVLLDGERIGYCTSGNFSPMYARGIALALLDSAYTLNENDIVQVALRPDRIVDTWVVSLPFWLPSPIQEIEDAERL
jgi:aminomethyltransferase